MDSLTIKLVSNVSSKTLPHNTLSSFTNFVLELNNLVGQFEVAISQMYYPSMYQNVTLGKVLFLYEKLSQRKYFNCPEAGLHSSVTHIVEANISKIPYRNSNNDTSIRMKVSRKTKKKTFPLLTKKNVWCFLASISDIFLELMFTTIWDSFARIITPQTIVCIGFCSNSFAHHLLRQCRVQKFWRHNSTFGALSSFHIEAEVWRY